MAAVGVDQTIALLALCTGKRARTVTSGSSLANPPPLDTLPKGILKNGNHGKSEETLKDNPTAMSDFKDIQLPLNDMLGDLDAANSILDLSSNPRLSFLSNESVANQFQHSCGQG